MSRSSAQSQSGAPGRAAPDGGVDLGLEIGQFALERLEQPVDALEGAPAGQAAPAVALGGHHLDDLAPAGDQLCERAGLFVGHRPGRRRDRFGEMGDRRGVQGVGLGELAGRPGEVADLARVDHRQRQARRTQRRRHRDLVAAGRLQHDQRRIEPAQPVRQIFQAFAVARDGKGLPRRPDMHVEPVLRHIDTHRNPFHDPSLQRELYV